MSTTSKAFADFFFQSFFFPSFRNNFDGRHTDKLDRCSSCSLARHRSDRDGGTDICSLKSKTGPSETPQIHGNTEMGTGNARWGRIAWRAFFLFIHFVFCVFFFFSSSEFFTSCSLAKTSLLLHICCMDQQHQGSGNKTHTEKQRKKRSQLERKYRGEPREQGHIRERMSLKRQIIHKKTEVLQVKSWKLKSRGTKCLYDSEEA